MPETPTHPRARDSGEPFVCSRCGGPCRRWKGTRHGWTCDRCLRRYVDRQIERHARKAAQQ